MTFQLDIDPIMRAIGEANPASARDFTDLPPLGPLPVRASSHARGLAVAGALAVAAVGAVAIVPSSTPGGNEVLERALAATSGQAEILHWRVVTDQPGLPAIKDNTNDVWLHVDAGGKIDRFHELRVDGPYAGMESVIDQPNGLGDVRGAVDRTRQAADGPITETKDMGLGEYGFADVIAAAQKAARGQLDLGDARSVSYDGHDAYEIRVRDAAPPASGSARTPSELGITLWVDRDTNLPLAVRYGDGAEVWMTEKIVSFARLPDDPEHRAQLDFTSHG
jgi:hypothetical protein